MNFFIHIPKTAGTYFTENLGNRGVNILKNCHQISTHNRLDTLSQAYSWASGHVPMHQYREEWACIFPLSHTIFRNPYQRLYSALCWNYEIAAKKKSSHQFLFESHTPHFIVSILECVLNAKLIDNFNFITSYLLRWKENFAATQFLYTSKTDFSLSAINELTKTKADSEYVDFANYLLTKSHHDLNQLASFSVEENIDTYIDRVITTFSSISHPKRNNNEEPAKQSNSNESRAWINPNIFFSLTSKPFLHDYLLPDIMLYAAAKRKKCDLGSRELPCFSSVEDVKFFTNHWTPFPDHKSISRSPTSPEEHHQLHCDLIDSITTRIKDLGVSRREFNINCYVEKNPDVFYAYGDHAYWHWCQHGISEGRSL